MPYTITKPERTIRYPDGTVYRHEGAETRTFTSAAGLLRFCLNEGVFAQRYVNAKPKRFEHLYLSDREYGIFDTLCRWEGIRDHLPAMRRALARYNEIVHHLREVEPAWRPDTERTGNAEGIVHFADNSTEIHEIDKHGNRRRRMITAPHGDACF